MTTYYFVRHGKKGHPTANPGLSDLGQQEAQATAAYLKQFPIKAVFSSPLRRTLETADPIPQALGMRVVPDARLRERANFGDLPGQSLSEFVAMWERCNQERDFVPPNGDSSFAAGQRIEAFVQECHQQYPQTELVAVTHGGVIADFLRNVFSDADLARVRPDFAAQPYSGDIMVECSITVVSFDGENYGLEEIASASHLDDLYRVTNP